MKFFQTMIIILSLSTFGLWKANSPTDRNAFNESANEATIYSENVFSTEKGITPPPPDDGTGDGGGVTGTGDAVPIDTFLFIPLGIALFLIVMIKKLFPKIEI